MRRNYAFRAYRAHRDAVCDLGYESVIHISFCVESVIMNKDEPYAVRIESRLRDYKRKKKNGEIIKMKNGYGLAPIK
ncbi:hypothetical protein AFI02nite_12390 [Aliivibrio fischeri]|uniref:Uncharacterized protein n=1 Tax=Aliivibrio fischeri TaxID=668 RepID=A0A510UF43_ALIFS|nr:hypothetical protein AFI02nite_12390 [Aliivibrio fischeri]